MNKKLIRTGLETLFLSGAHLTLRPFLGGVGAILTLHHVRPARRGPFQPNRLLEVTPEFLEKVIVALRRADIDLISLDEMHRRLSERCFWRRFVCLTFDDGYRDNLRYAYPILKRHQAPFTIYIPTSFPDQMGELWWVGLEAVIAGSDRIGLVMDGVERRFECADAEQKNDVFEAIYWWLRSLPSEQELRRVVNDLCNRYRTNLADICRDLCMTWDELGQLAGDPLVTVGAHTVNHVMLKKASDEEALAEMKMSASVIEAALGARPRHFSYPIGDPTSAGPREFRMAAAVGFATAVTTRPGVLFPEHRKHLTALPRISLNGDFQQMRYVRVLLSGAATAINSGFRRVDAA